MYLICQATAVENVAFGWAFAKMILAMIAIIVLAIFSLRYLLPRLVQMKRRKNSSIEVLDFQPLEQRKSVYLIKVENKKVALAVSEHAIAKLCEWDA